MIRDNSISFLEQYDMEAGLAFRKKKIESFMPLLVFCGLGIGGEAGEALEKIKKLYRDEDGVLTPQTRMAILKELGDVVFYVNAAAKQLDSSLEEVLELSVDKTQDRTARGVLDGSGDDR